MTGGDAQRRSGVVAAFDFDGTITRRDTLAGFLARVAGRRALAATLLAESPRLIARRGGDQQRDATKERVLARIFAGRSCEEVSRAGRAYATELPSRYRSDVIERLRWHREQDHELVMVSASLDCYLRHVARELGFDHLICIELEVGEDGRLTGKLKRPNVRGNEKVRRLREYLGGEPTELWAYGNSAGDEAMLSLADHAVRIRPRCVIARNP
ncbi:MAG: hypothetical protein JJLCMIEE_03210 [Acidimicrobiales bacterium]|nr:hypothetical protein [Acidimicrobiales bacterium]